MTQTWLWPDNFRLPEVLPDAPPIVPPVVILDVHLEVLTFSDHTEVIPTHPRSLKAKKKVCGGGWVVQTKNRV